MKSSVAIVVSISLAPLLWPRQRLRVYQIPMKRLLYLLDVIRRPCVCISKNVMNQ